jgi:hypothetical protein
MVDGVFVADGEQGPVIDLDHPLPLALLHLAAAVDGASVDLPVCYPNNTSFDPKVIVAQGRG